MKTGILSFTKGGRKLALKLEKILKEERTVLLAEGKEVKGWCKLNFYSADEIIFIGAAGIAVRMIAPLLKDKTVDPGVIVLDEKGEWVISLLSGHFGGANELTEYIADRIGATPVITTATDVRKVLAVDVFAKKNNLFITDPVMAKRISQILVDGGKVGFCCESEIIGEVPEELIPGDETTEGLMPWIRISVKDDQIKKNELRLIPKGVILGMGCRRGKTFETLENQLKEYLRKSRIRMEAIKGVATIVLKQNEPGIITLCEKYHLPLFTYTPEELQGVPGNFSESEFVERVTGVGNVCERAAVLGAGGGALIAGKEGESGATLALASLDWSVKFE